jgi:hypothetical protein
LFTAMLCAVDLRMDPKHAIWQRADEKYVSTVLVFVALALVALFAIGVGIGYLLG